MTGTMATQAAGRRWIYTGLAGVLGTVFAAQAVLAAPMVTISQEVSTTTAFTASSTDLINGLMPTAASNNGGAGGSESTSNDVGILTDGVYGSAGGSADWRSFTFTVTRTAGPTPSPTILYYSLDLTNAPNGYDVTGIETYSSWGDQNRNQQYYEVSYATVSDPQTFVSLTSVQGNLNVGAPSNRKVSLAISELTNVAAVKFDFSGNLGFDYTGYRELDVIGGASIPEPAGLAGLGLAALGLIARRRRLK